MNLFDIRLEKDAETDFTVPASHNTALLVINGNIEVNGQAVAEHSFVLFNNDGEEISVKANDKATVLVLSGEPINEPIASYGPFVMNTQEEIYQPSRISRKENSEYWINRQLFYSAIHPRGLPVY